MKTACHYWSTGEAPEEFDWLHNKNQESKKGKRSKKVKGFKREVGFKQVQDLGGVPKEPRPMSAVLQRWLAAFK